MLHWRLFPALCLCVCLTLAHPPALGSFLSQPPSFFEINLLLSLCVSIYSHSFKDDLNNYPNPGLLQHSKSLFSSSCWAFAPDGSMSTARSASSTRLSSSSPHQPLCCSVEPVFSIIDIQYQAYNFWVSSTPCSLLSPSSQPATCLRLLCLQCLHHLSSSRSCGSCFRLDCPPLFPGLLKFLVHPLLHYTVPSQPPAKTPITLLISWRRVYDHFAHSLITSQCLSSETQVPKLGVQGPANYGSNQ